MNDDQLLLANAYLDGELTADERAAAESDPEVMAEVEQLRAMQAELRAVDAPSTAARESAIAAALAEFAPAIDPPATTPAPTPFRTPLWYRRALAIAAAAVGVGLLGVVVVNLNRGDDDAADSVIDIATDDSGDAGDDSGDAGDDGDVDGREFAESVGDAGEDTSDGDAAGAAADEEMATVPAAASDDSAEASDAGDVASDTDTAALPPGTVAIEWSLDVRDPMTLPRPAELAEAGAALSALYESEALPPTPETLCVFTDADDPSEILERMVFETEREPIELLVAIDPAGEIVYAIDPDTCELVVEAPLP